MSSHGINPFGRTRGPFNVRELNEVQKQWIALLYISGKKDYNQILNTYGVLKETAKKWVSRTRRGLTCHGKGGRPRCVDAGAEKILVDSVKKRKHLVGETSWDQMFKDALDSTAAKRGIPPKGCCVRTIRNYKKLHNLTSGSAENLVDSTNNNLDPTRRRTRSSVNSKA